MTDHARPHLTTHVRSKNHSAVAGAAYRLGIKILDERTHIVHDYSKRCGKGVVFGETIGPPGIPAGLLDPATLWNEVEQAERYKDAQLARDFRIPIPLGLSEKDAIAMSKAMAGYLVSRFHVPVSLAVHRDNVVDLDGNTKPESKIGYHAHLYFPTRRLERSGEGNNAVWTFGAKITELSNRRTSSTAVDEMNQKWAILANRFAAKAGLPADYEWKSYARQGLNKQPQPERARRFGIQNRWYRPATGAGKGSSPNPQSTASTGAEGGQVLQAEQHSRVYLRLDSTSFLQRVAARRGVSEVKVAARAVRYAVARLDARASNEAVALGRKRSGVGKRTKHVRHLGLASLIRNSGKPPTNPAEQAALERAVAFAEHLEELFRSLERARERAHEYALEHARVDRVLADARAKRERAEDELRRARRKLSRWRKDHPLRAALPMKVGVYPALASRCETGEKRVLRIDKAIEDHRDDLATLSRRHGLKAAFEERAIQNHLDKARTYKDEFQWVVGMLGVHLSASQWLDARRIAEDLGVDMPVLRRKIQGGIDRPMQRRGAPPSSGLH